MYVEACLLWSLIDLRSFRLPVPREGVAATGSQPERAEDSIMNTRNMTTAETMSSGAVAMAEIRRIISEENLEDFTSEELIDTCCELLRSHDAAIEADARRTPEVVDFLATLDSAIGRAEAYDDTEKKMITSAVTRANRALANR